MKDPLERWKGREDRLVDSLRLYVGTVDGIADALRSADFAPEANVADEPSRLLRGRTDQVKTLIGGNVVTIPTPRNTAIE